MNPKATSAGGLVVRRGITEWETLLVGLGEPTVWRIPKGMQNQDETIEQTAVREVLEETGVHGIILAFIGTAGWTYVYEGQDWDETVFFFLMKLGDGNTESHDSEYERVEWFTLKDAIKALYYRNEAEIVEKAISLVRLLPNTPKGGDEIQEILIDKAFDEITNIDYLRLLGSGLSLGDNVATGRAVMNGSSLDEFAQRGEPVIFVTNELAPRDASLFTRSEGLLAAQGGITSHMAVVMRGFGKVCISGIQGLSITTGFKSFSLRGQTINEGEWLTLDERSGGIYLGKAELRHRHVSPESIEIMARADETRRVRVLVNADDRNQVKKGLIAGADGVGLVRSEHQILADKVLEAFLCVLLLHGEPQGSRCVEAVTKALEDELVEMLKILGGKPLHYRLLDAPINEFIPREGETLTGLAQLVGMQEDQVRNKLSILREANSLIGCRGSRWGLVHREFYKHQIDLAIRAGMRVASEDDQVSLTIIVPMVSAQEELKHWSSIFQRKLAEKALHPSFPLEVRLGAMVETPRAALICAKLAEYVDVLCLGTNDLTQAVWAMSRDDASSSLLAGGIIDHDPFRTLDKSGVGALIEKAVSETRKVKADAKFYVCGEHASDPESARYLIGLGIDGLSCRIDRVAAIKVVAAQVESSLLPAPSTAGLVAPVSDIAKSSTDLLELIIAEVQQSNHVEAQKIALRWARKIAEYLNIESPTVWKYFKRSLVEKWFGVGERKRFGPGWSTVDAVAYAVSHPDRKVRYSLFPLNIACHAISKALPENSTAETWRAEMELLDHSVPVEIFPQPPEDNLCFRAIFEGCEQRYEAGLGQAMYVFEEERGQHPFVQGCFDTNSEEARITGRNRDRSLTAPIEEGLIKLLNLHAADLLRTSQDICAALGVRWIAIEGYYDLQNESAPFICDLDLPQDLAFHA